jgi:hypothetical protein
MLSFCKKSQIEYNDELSKEEEKCKKETDQKFHQYLDEHNRNIRKFIRNELTEEISDSELMNFIKSGESLNYNNKMADFGMYAMYCWMREKEVFITPDFVQNSILNLFAQHTTGTNECRIAQIKDLFTKFNHKQQLCSIGNLDTKNIIADLFNQMSLSGLNDELSNIANTIFSNDTNQSGRLFSQFCLLDIGRYFYDFSRYGVICGVPSVNVQGTIDDWNRLKNNIVAFKELIKTRLCDMKEYIDKCLQIIDNIIEHIKSPSEKTHDWIMSCVTSEARASKGCGKYKEHEMCGGPYRDYEGSYIYPKLCGWLIELTTMKSTREIKDLHSNFRLLPFKSEMHSGQISYYCIIAFINIDTHAKEGKNWEYVFKMFKISFDTYDYLKRELNPDICVEFNKEVDAKLKEMEERYQLDKNE